MENCYFNHVISSIHAFGSGVYAPPTYDTLEVTNCTFKNLLYGASGLAVYFNRNKRSIVKNCSFDNIKIGGSGTVYFDTNEVNIIKNCTFNNQIMPHGGSIFILSRHIDPDTVDL